MPILKIEIDGEYLEFIIIPLNFVIYEKIKLKYIKNGFVDKAGFLSHIMKKPKMSRKEWGDVPSSILIRILKSIEYYIESIEEKQRTLRQIYMELHVLEDEVDDLYRVFNDEPDDWVWNAIRRKDDKIKKLNEEKKEIETSLEMIKENKALFEKDKEVNYEIQSLQLEN